MRVIRPLEVPATKEAKEKYWKSDAIETDEGVENRIQEGRGGYGLVDEELPAAIKSLDD
jgi:hypothetical protein